ncbi:MAG: EAL domain-containing protein [Gammaproteobacteria bacterium]|nr:EAL domain-containing protein [Gammaproteobacteria bacterium]
MGRSNLKEKVLVVDDEPQVLDALEDTLEEDFWVLKATSPARALETLKKERNISVILSDQRMPGVPGHEFLARAREVSDASRILITAYSDIDAVIAAVNQGKIFGYVSKPWDRAALRIVVYKAAEHHSLLHELHEREERFRQLAENIRDVFWMMDANTGKGIYLSPAYEEIWGRSRQELRDHPDSWLEAVHPEDRAAIVGMHKGNGGEVGLSTVEYRVIRPDRSVRWVRERYFPVKDADGKVYRIAGVAEDMTERKEAETLLRQTNEKLSALVNSSPLAIGMLDPDANVLMWNPAAERMFGWSAQEVIGHQYPLVPEFEWGSFLAIFRKNMEGASVSGLEQRRRRKDGTMVDVALWTTPLEGADGRIFAGMFIMADVTERKAQEQKIARLTRIYAVLSGINSAIVRIHDRQTLFEEACRIAVQHGHFDVACILRYDPAEQTVAPVCWDGVPGDVEFMEKMTRTESSGAAAKAGTVGRAVSERRPVYCNDFALEPDVGLARWELLKRGYRSVISLPLMPGGNCFGVMVLYVKEKDVFDELELRLLTELASDISFGLEYIDKEERANYLAYYDPLTGLTNRAMFHERLDQYMQAAQRERARMALLVLDIDRFKTINDTLGRNIGDALLRQIAERLRGQVTDPNKLARIGADQFARVLPGIQHADDAARVIHDESKICFGPPFRVGDEELRISAKIGIAIFPDDGQDADMLFRNAEAAVKKAKDSGDSYLFYTEKMSEQVAENLRLDNELRKALENREFVLHYQPKVELDSGRISGLEALIRWNHPERGLVPPMEFIPVLEETGLILDVGEWALEQAAADYRAWREQYKGTPRVAVNVSAIQLRQHQFAERVNAAIRRHGDAVTLDLEITESNVMENIDGNMEKLLALKMAGLGIVIDDFGTGYSSLSYIARMPISSLKIDRSFIVGMTASLQSRLIVSTIISLAHALNLKVVAEGVDAEEQLDVLRELRCDEIQGFLFSRPLPANEILPLLEKSAPLRPRNRPPTGRTGKR